ncbi:hypothetical protein G6F63_016403 [Rhizopus arrhizus]|nr:hypothetical protein G6F63_016403 [Rhizopus arrhizus]
MLATETETLHQGRVIKRVGGVQQRLGALQRGTQLADVPALDDRDAVLQHLAGAHAQQQFARAAATAHPGLHPRRPRAVCAARCSCHRRWR